MDRLNDQYIILSIFNDVNIYVNMSNYIYNYILIQC